MKVALVHELLTMKGGAERVLRVLARMFPDAPIYTLLYDERKLCNWFPKERVRTSVVQQKADRWPLFTGRYNHHLYLKDFPAAVESFDFSEFDLVISSSSAFAHGIITNGKPKHLCYVHSPARYLWDRTHDVLERANRGLLGAMKRRYLEKTFHELRVWDSETAPRPDRLIAASKEVQRRIELYWDRTSDVAYPPIADSWFLNTPNPNPNPNPFFLIVSTLASYKRIDLAIDACNKLKLHLKIVGDGPQRAALEGMAGPTIEFYGYRDGDELRDLFANAKATIVPGEEDFGLVPIESMASGTPVIGYGKGGLIETVVPDETGTFFAENNVESLMQKIASFDQKKYSKENCRKHAENFRESVFVQKMHTEIDRLMK
ncbi:MAG TPA: glycosyltransferase [Candidatus Peribacteraceae bacterium]|nr:glycosyltransferase [Candidatus Peribacteraceae bacterium]